MSATTPAADFRTGAAMVDMTPQRGTPMAGYYFERAAEGVHDPLLAKALVIEQGSAKAALVSLDLISTVRHFVEAARREIEQATGIPAAHVMISATHAHTGPIFGQTSARYDALGGTNSLALEYTRQLPHLIAEAVRQANARLAPVKVSVASGRQEGLAFNRRFFMRDGTVGWNPGKLNPNIIRPAGPTDPEVPIVYFEGSARHPVATYINFAMHLDTIGGNQFSADAPFTLSKLLAAVKGTNMISVFTTGCCGDVNHVNVNWAEPQKGTAESARIGTILAACVLRSYEQLRLLTNELTLRVRTQTVKLPLPEITAEEIAQARQTVLRSSTEAGTGASRAKFLDLVNAFKVLDVAAREGRAQEVEVQVIALGDELAWVGLPGEIFVELGLAIKQGSPFRHTIVVELANGSIGYIPNRVAWAQGNYEVLSARCAPGSGEMLVDTALRLLRGVHAESVKAR